MHQRFGRLDREPRPRTGSRALAEVLAAIEARPLDDPQAQLAAMPSHQAAQRLSDYIDERLRIPGAEDMTAALRPSRIAQVDGCTFMLPTVIYCTDPNHPLARAEFLFPFVTVVEVPRAELVGAMESSLVVTALTDDETLRHQLLTAPHVERLNLGAMPTNRVAWDQPHEGNLFELLYKQRSLQAAG